MTAKHAPPKPALGRTRLQVVMQTEAAECGLACLAMIAAHHGLQTDLATLRRRFSLSLKGATMADLVRMAAELRLGARPLRADLEHLSQLELPCILHWDMNHFVVLESVGVAGVKILDPARGARRLSLVEVSRHFTGIALELTPEAGFEPRDERQKIELSALLGRVRGLRRSLLQILALALALEAFALLAPFFMQWVVDGVLPGADLGLLQTLGTGFALLVLVHVATGALRSWAVLHMASTMNVQWVCNVFAHLLRLPMDWFEKRHTGDVMSRFGAIQQIQQTLTTHFVEAVLDGLLVVATLGMMLLYSAQLAAVALACVALYALLRAALFRRLRDATEEEIVQDARRATHFLESLAGVRAIKLFKRRADRQARFANLVVDGMNATLRVRRLELAQQAGHRLLFGLERVAVVWLGALLVLQGGFTLGMLFAFVAFKEQFAARVSGLIDKLAELRMLGLQAERLSDIVLTAPESEAGSLPPQAADPAPRLELRGLSFRYADAEPDVLLGCSLTVEAGESVAIVGPSGCGKTTLLKLMLGVHAPRSGEILVGGVGLQRLGLARWRDMIGTVMQDDTLFAGTVADNIAFFDAEPDPAWVRACARMASVDEEIEAMPMGYESLIGSLGASFSGGQRQRILLARALYKRPRILFLDEATSALDVDRERLVNRAVARLALTRVIVAHRPETVASADRVIVLRNGAAHSLARIRGGQGRGSENA